jgi:hypothetical protein
MWRHTIWHHEQCKSHKDKQKKTGVNSDAPININSNGSVFQRLTCQKVTKAMI